MHANGMVACIIKSKTMNYLKFACMWQKLKLYLLLHRGLLSNLIFMSRRNQLLDLKLNI